MCIAWHSVNDSQEVIKSCVFYFPRSFLMISLMVIVSPLDTENSAGDRSDGMGTTCWCVVAVNDSKLVEGRTHAADRMTENKPELHWEHCVAYNFTYCIRVKQWNGNRTAWRAKQSQPTRDGSTKRTPKKNNDSVVQPPYIYSYFSKHEQIDNRSRVGVNSFLFFFGDLMLVRVFQSTFEFLLLP